jgi:prefoldin subunit 5
MEKITNKNRLKNAIQVLEAEQLEKELILRNQFLLTYENLKPASILKNTLIKVGATPFLFDTILSTIVGVGTGYVSKKIIIGASGNILRKIFGVVMQLIITNVVSRHPEAIMSVGNLLFKKNKQNND